jgi:hypothetical protein
MDDIQGAQDGISTPGQDHRGQAEDRHRAEVRAKSGEVPDIFQGKDKQSIQPGFFHNLFGFLHPLPPEPIEINPFFPIYSHKSEF